MLPPPISPLSDYTEKRVPGGTFEHESWELYTQSAGPGKEGEIDVSVVAADRYFKDDLRSPRGVDRAG